MTDVKEGPQPVQPEVPAVQPLEVKAPEAPAPVEQPKQV